MKNVGPEMGLYQGRWDPELPDVPGVLAKRLSVPMPLGRVRNPLRIGPQVERI